VAPKSKRAAFIFGMVLAVAVIILAIMTWADPDLAEPISSPEAIYQLQHLNVY
jgi:hypothetical protein